jgi:hypothetical protein
VVAAAPGAPQPHLGGDGRAGAAGTEADALGNHLGLTTAARYAPILLLSPYAGLLVDRYPKRVVTAVVIAIAWVALKPCATGEAT